MAKSKFDPRNIFRLNLIAVPARFMANLAFAGAWGLFLQPGKWYLERTAGCAAVSALSILLCLSFFGWDKEKLTVTRAALYGLYTAGKALMIGTGVLVFLWAYNGRLELGVMCLTAFGGGLFTVASGSMLLSKIAKKPGGRRPTRISKQ